MKKVGLCLVALIACVCAATTSHALSAPVWQSTFNCNDWNTMMGLSDAQVCGAGDGLVGHGAWTTPGHRSGDEITAAANYPSGAGGKGFRHWRCDGFDCNGGGIKLILP